MVLRETEQVAEALLRWTGEGTRPEIDTCHPHLDSSSPHGLCQFQKDLCYCLILGFATEYSKSVKKFTKT